MHEPEVLSALITAATELVAYRREDLESEEQKLKQLACEFLAAMLKKHAIETWE